MVAPELQKIGKQIELNSAENTPLRIAFGIACVTRVEASLTDATIIDALQVGKRYLQKADDDGLRKAATDALSACRSHQGSNSFDGSGNAAVSSSYAVAAALGGRALEAAGYAAYAAVYAYSCSSVTDVASYQDEHRWQINTLKTLIDVQKLR